MSREPKNHLYEQVALMSDVEIVAYCREPFSLLSNEAVSILKKRSYQAYKIGDGVAEWAADDFSIESEL